MLRAVGQFHPVPFPVKPIKLSLRVAAQKRNVLLQAVVVLLQNAAVSVLLPHIPAQERISRLWSPGRRGRRCTCERNCVGQRAIGKLCVTNVANSKILGVKGGHIKIHHGLLRSLAHRPSTLPFVTLVAIRRNAEEIGELRPVNERPNVIQGSASKQQNSPLSPPPCGTCPCRESKLGVPGKPVTSTYRKRR